MGIDEASKPPTHEWCFYSAAQPASAHTSCRAHVCDCGSAQVLYDFMIIFMLHYYSHFLPTFPSTSGMWRSHSVGRSFGRSVAGIPVNTRLIIMFPLGVVFVCGRERLPFFQLLLLWLMNTNEFLDGRMEAEATS